MKIGKAIPKAVIEITEEQRTELFSAISTFAKENNLAFEYRAEKQGYLVYEYEGVNARTHTFTLQPKNCNYNQAKFGTSKPKTVRIVPNMQPSIRIAIDCSKSLIEGTDEYVNQFHYFIRTSCMQEREYRHRNWESFSGYLSFDYDTDAKTLAESIIQSLNIIVNAYKPLFA